MSAFTAAFLFFVIFCALIGAAALFFLSFDAEGSENPAAAVTTTQRLFQAIRRVNTDTIETVDAAGNVRQWRSE
jgi:hypothetical protein